MPRFADQAARACAISSLAAGSFQSSFGVLRFRHHFEMRDHEVSSGRRKNAAALAAPLSSIVSSCVRSRRWHSNAISPEAIVRKGASESCMIKLKKRMPFSEIKSCRKGLRAKRLRHGKREKRWCANDEKASHFGNSEIKNKKGKWCALCIADAVQYSST